MNERKNKKLEFLCLFGFLFLEIFMGLFIFYECDDEGDVELWSEGGRRWRKEIKLGVVGLQ